MCVRYFGPYKILKKVGTVAYLFELPEGSQLHPVFHEPQLQLPTCDAKGQELIQPVAILQWKVVKIDNGVGVKVLVKWANLKEEDAT